MLPDNLLNRINELAKLSKQRQLTESEKAEQQELRQRYLKNFRRSFAKQVEEIKVIDKEGNDLTPDHVKEIQKKRGLFGRHQDKTDKP